MVGPRSDSRLRLGETPAGASSAVNDSQRRESEANGPRGQRLARVSRGGPSWTEFVRLAHQAVRSDQRGWRNRGQDLMAIWYNARKGRHTAPLHSTGPDPTWRGTSDWGAAFG